MEKKLLQQHWQIPLSTQKSCTGIDDIYQCITNILITRKGTDILRPSFGSNHFDWIDYPEDEAIPNMVREIFEALTQWEPRILIEEVIVTGIAPHFTITVRWRLKNSIETAVIESVIPAF